MKPHQHPDLWVAVQELALQEPDLTARQVVEKALGDYPKDTKLKTWTNLVQGTRAAAAAGVQEIVGKSERPLYEEIRQLSAGRRPVLARLLILSEAEPTAETIGLLEPWDGELATEPAGHEWPGQWIVTAYAATSLQEH